MPRTTIWRKVMYYLRSRRGEGCKGMISLWDSAVNSSGLHSCARHSWRLDEGKNWRRNDCFVMAWLSCCHLMRKFLHGWRPVTSLYFWSSMGIYDTSNSTPVWRNGVEFLNAKKGRTLVLQQIKLFFVNIFDCLFTFFSRAEVSFFLQ